MFLTHSDMDHVAGIPLFKMPNYIWQETEVKCWMAKTKIRFYSNSISRADYILLDDQQNLEIGNIKFIAYLLKDTQWFDVLSNKTKILPGDILSLHDGKLGHSVKFFDLDHDGTTKSISKITKSSKRKTILTSHLGHFRKIIKTSKDWKE